MTSWVPFRRHLAFADGAVEALCERVHRADELGLDTESSGPNLVAKSSGTKSMLDVHRSNLTGISLAFDDGESFYVPLDHKRGAENASLRSALKLEEALLASRARRVWVHNLDHELHAFSRPPAPFSSLLATLRARARGGAAPVWRCTALQARLLCANPIGGYGLKVLAPKLLGLEMGSFQEVAKGGDFDQLRPKDGLDYACEDAEAALRLGQLHERRMGSLERIRDWYDEVESPLVWVFNDMERHGMPLDERAHRETIQYLRARQGEAQASWDRLLGGIKPTSALELQALYDVGEWPITDGLGWDAEEKASGFSTDKAHKEKLAEICAEGSIGRRAAELLMELSGTQKLLSSYGPKLSAAAGSHLDGRFRDSLKQCGTKTLRTTSSVLLLVPKHSQDGQRIRESFVAPEGRSFVAGDYSQVEYRVLAHFARHGTLFDGFHAGIDPHEATARAMGVPRNPTAKTLNFSTIYGSGPHKVASTVGCSFEQAQAFLEEVPKRLVAEIDALDRAENAGLRNGYVASIAGTRRPVYLASALRRKRRLYKEGKRWDDRDGVYRRACKAVGRERRIARNTVIQMSAANIMSKGLLRLWRNLDDARASLCLTIHDDAVGTVDDDYAGEAKEIWRESLEGAWDLRVPLAVDVRSGKRWSDLK